MSTSEIKKIEISKRLIFNICRFLLIAFLIVIFWILRNIQVEKLIRNQQQAVSASIINTINEQAKQDLFNPNIVFVNLDSANSKKINDSISKQIAVIVAKKYLGNQTPEFKKLKFAAYFKFPEFTDNKGCYTLTKNQLDELKYHIEFLTSQIDKAITVTKDEINKEIDRINTWVTIWIGVLSIFGTIIPLFYNYKNNEELKTIKEKASIAETKSEAAHSLINSHKEDISKVKGISAELITLNDSFLGFKEDVGQAKKDSIQALSDAKLASDKAVKIEKMVLALNDISKIKDIDSTFLLYNNEPLQTLIRYLQEIHSNLSSNSELYAESITKDVLRQLALRLHLIAPSGFIGPTNFELLNQFSLNISNLITNTFTQDSYIRALDLLNTLNANLIKNGNKLSNN